MTASLVRSRLISRIASHANLQSVRSQSVRSFSTTSRPSAYFTQYTSANNPVPENVKQSLTAYGSQISLPISWGQQDGYRHVNNVSYAQFVESARINAMLSMCDYLDVPNPVAYAEEYMAGNGKGVILRKLHIDYKSPAKYPDILTIGTAVELMGNDRFRFRHRLVSNKTGLVVAEADDVLVSYDYSTETKCDLPQVVLDAVTKFARMHPGEPKKSNGNGK